MATGIKLANTDLKVVITGGDGDGYGIGIGHFIHAMRRNLDLTYVVMDNQIYGLTTGQASPTTMKDARTKSTPERQRRVAHQSAGAGAGFRRHLCRSRLFRRAQSHGGSDRRAAFSTRVLR